MVASAEVNSRTLPQTLRFSTKKLSYGADFWWTGGSYHSISVCNVSMFLL